MAHRVRHSHFLLLFEFFLLAGVENGSVISSVGVIESFRHLVPANGAGEAADAGRTAAGGKGGTLRSWRSPHEGLPKIEFDNGRKTTDDHAPVVAEY